MDVEALKESLRQAEGFRPYVFNDSLGFWTIGYGRMVDKRLNGGITTQEAEILLSNDVQNSITNLDQNLSWYSKLSDPRQRALAELCFQLGINKLLGFVKMLTAMANYNFNDAAIELLDSDYAQQVPARASRLAGMLKNG